MRILVGMSGGVDSSYAALKLIKEGHEVEGAYLMMHEYSELDAARSAAERLGIPLHIIDCRDRFDNIVRTSFVDEYKKGRTPNPCIVCNPGVKFPALVEYAEANGFDKIATGHYAKAEKLPTGIHAVGVAADISKDQSYMLYRLGENILSRLILPLGEETKAQIREQIKDTDLSVLDRADSQEICFIPDGAYAEYIEEKTGKCPEGSFIDADGNILGNHKGIIRYTVGQRKGLGIALGERAFVTDIDPIANTVRLERAPALSLNIRINDLHITDLSAFSDPDATYAVKVRYGAKAAPARVKIDADEATISFEIPQRSVTPGQSAVIYKDGIVVGGGFICK